MDEKEIWRFNRRLRKKNNNLPVIEEILDHAVYKAITEVITDEKVGEIVIYNKFDKVDIFFYNGKPFKESTFLSEICAEAAIKLKDELFPGAEKMKLAIERAKRLGRSVSNKLAKTLTEEMDKIVNETIATGVLQGLDRFCDACAHYRGVENYIHEAILIAIGLDVEDEEMSDFEKDRRKRAYYLLEREDEEYRNSDIH